MDATSTVVTATTVLASVPAAVAGVRAYRALSGDREIVCPETKDAALVRIAVAQAIASRVTGRNEVRLKYCSRWPGKAGCDQACVSQILATPGGCRLRALQSQLRGAQRKESSRAGRPR